MNNYSASAELIAALGRVGVLMGGTSAEREVSLASGSAVLKALQAAGVDAIGIDYKGDITALKTQPKLDRVFLALHGRGGEDGVIQGVLDTLRIPYTGSGVMGSAIAMDKMRSKYIWEGMNLPTPRFGYVDEFKPGLISQLVSLMGFPLAVKPAREGSSIGVYKVNNQSQLEAAIEGALKLDQQVLLEQWVEGDEFTIGLLGGEALPVIGLRTDNTFYDYEAKYESNDTKYLLPCGLNAEEEKSLGHLAERAFEALGCDGWGRVDVMRDSRGRFWLLEVNTIPGMTGHSLVPMAAQAKGVDMSELVTKILQQTLIDFSEERI
jgi:D-alanine-D-alanine ligase